jgi:F420H(2)-dependent quinone reductase
MDPDLHATQPAGAQGLLQRLGGTAFGVWAIKHVISPLDRHLYRWTSCRGVAIGRPMAPRLLLTTIGRRTGQAHTVPIFYLRDGDRLIICNVHPGFERPNPWPLNLRANPVVQLQVGSERGAYRAREATQEEVKRYWPQLVGIWPAYQSEFDRSGQRSLFLLERVPLTNVH